MLSSSSPLGNLLPLLSLHIPGLPQSLCASLTAGAPVGPQSCTDGGE